MSFFKNNHNNLISKPIISLFIGVFCFSSFTPLPTASAQQIFKLPAVGIMLMPTQKFVPTLIKGIKIFPNDPFRFDFIVDTGNANLNDEALTQESTKIIKYFLASLTVPEEDLWVNLSPYEKDRIIPNAFGITEMGRDLLAQDYLLKQLTASLMYPENELGEKFWDKVYEKALEKYGTIDIPINTFNKVWIIPENAIVYENKDTAFVIESHLKVMLEEDFLALEKNLNNKKFGIQQLDNPEIESLSKLSSTVVHDIIIPAIEKEVNEGKHFAQLRQIYHAFILASWFKTNLKESLLGKIYVDQNKVNGIDIEDKNSKEKIYNQYVEAFKKGVYNYVRDDYDPGSQTIIPKKYFAGGVRLKTSLSASPITFTKNLPFTTTTVGKIINIQVRTDEPTTIMPLLAASPLKTITAGNFNGSPSELKKVLREVKSFQKANTTAEIILKGNFFGRGENTIEIFNILKDLINIQNNSDGSIKIHLLLGENEINLIGSLLFSKNHDSVPYTFYSRANIFFQLKKASMKTSGIFDRNDNFNILKKSFAEFILQNFEILYIDEEGDIHTALQFDIENLEEAVSQLELLESNWTDLQKLEEKKRLEKPIHKRSTSDTSLIMISKALTQPTYQSPYYKSSSPLDTINNVNAETTSPALKKQTSAVGGIDLDRKKLDLQTRGERIEFNSHFDLEYFQSNPINGLIPVILNITPIQSLPLFLGINENDQQPTPISFSKEPEDILSESLS